MQDLVIICAFILFCLGLIIFLIRDKIIVTLGVRNIVLRKKYALLVILGLMIGTAVITSSLVVGDTMNTMVKSEILETFHTTDEKIIGVTPTGERDYFNESVFDDLRSFLEVPFIDGVSPSIRDRVAILNLETNLSDPSVFLVGIDFATRESFGSFITISGQEITDLGNTDLLMGEKTADDLDANVGDRFILYSQGNYRFLTLTDIVKPGGRGGTGWNLFVTLTTAQDILNKSGQINEILISNRGGVREGLTSTVDVQALFETLSFPDTLEFQLGDIKQEVLDENTENMRIFTDMFFVFGSFSIIAGVILIINIFVMLAEERKSEMGMARAIGMQRKQLKRMYLSEGCVYAGLSSLVGVFLGVGIGFLVMFAISRILSGFGVINIIQYFTVNPHSMVLGFITGFLITLATIYVTAHRISRLNIVRAIRNIPEPPVLRRNRRLFALGIGLAVCSTLLIFMGMMSYQASLFFTGISLFIFSLGFIARRWIGDRWAFNLVALFILVLWFLPGGLFPTYTGGIEMFIISGLFLVFASLLLVMVNSVQITQGLTFLLGWGKSMQAVLKTAISYSLRSKFRTGMTIAIFALIIFSITTMSMIVGILGTNIESQVKKSAGGYEILAFSLPTSPVMNITHELQEKGLDSSIENAVGLFNGQVFLSLSSSPNDTFSYYLIGINNDFIRYSEFEFEKILDTYKDPGEVWMALRENSSLIIIDSSVLGAQFGLGSPSPFITDVGETLVIRDKNNETHEKKIIGILDTSLIQGIFIYDFHIKEDFDLPGPTFFLMNVPEQANVENLSKTIESQFLQYGLQVLDLKNLVLEALRAMNQFFTLFESFMALGLIIGIAGLGIITIRSVHERRQEIGMMRALGFQRKMVLHSFIIETSFVAIIGIVIGVILGIAIGYLLWRDEFASQGLEFMINWQPIITVSIISFFVTLLSIIPASRKASRVPPAEALRYMG